MGRQVSHYGPDYDGVSGSPPSFGAPQGTIYGAKPAPVPPPVPPYVPVPAPRKRRTVLVAACAVLLVLVVAAGALVVLRPGPVRGWLAGSAPTAAPPAASITETPESPPPPVLLAAGADGAAPTAAGVRAAIGSLVKDRSLGSRVNISVVDVAGAGALFSANPDAMTTPASTTKLVTAATVLAARGPGYRLTTRVVAGAKPGEVVIIGGGDPTLATRSNRLFPGAARLDKLAAQVKKALGGVKPTGVVVDGTLFTGPTLGPGWDSDLIFPGGQVARITALSINAGRIDPVHHLHGGDPRYADPSNAAGKAFAKALGIPNAPVTSGKAPEAAPAGAVPGVLAPGAELGSVQSPPLVRIVDWMLELSDNVLAESLARQVALAAGEPASFTGAAAAMEAAVLDLGLPAEESDLHDGSGLSRNNKMTPSMLTDLLKLAAGGTKPELTAMFGGLPVAGWSGTLQDRFLTSNGNRTGRGLVRAKTGSLSGVSALSGELVTRDGRLLVFAILADGVPGGQIAARAALDRIATELVACGCS